VDFLGADLIETERGKLKDLYKKVAMMLKFKRDLNPFTFSSSFFP
jgi:hypothetical protein